MRPRHHAVALTPAADQCVVMLSQDSFYRNLTEEDLKDVKRESLCGCATPATCYVSFPAKLTEEDLKDVKRESLWSWAMLAICYALHAFFAKLTEEDLEDMQHAHMVPQCHTSCCKHVACLLPSCCSLPLARQTLLVFMPAAFDRAATCTQHVHLTKPRCPCIPLLFADYNFDSPQAFDKEAILKCMRELKVCVWVGALDFQCPASRCLRCLRCV